MEPLGELLPEFEGQVSETVVTRVATKSCVFALLPLELCDDSALVPLFPVVLVLFAELLEFELLALLPRLDPGAPAVPSARTWWPTSALKSCDPRRCIRFPPFTGCR